jgi:hypothetical protein
VTDVLGSVGQEKFFLDEIQEEISVLKYFKRRYKIDLNPNGPCLELKGKNQVPAEVSIDCCVFFLSYLMQICVIMQLCVIKKGQSFSRKLDDNQTRNMLTVAKKDPHVLKREIQTEVLYRQCNIISISYTIVYLLDFSFADDQ